MALAINFNEIVQRAKEDTLRTLIMIDGNQSTFVYGKFNYGYNDPEAIDAVTLMFDESYSTLQKDAKREGYSVLDLPIIRFLGRWGVTVVRRTTSNQVIIEDGCAAPVDAYIGLDN
jgi:hypothetical protein